MTDIRPDQRGVISGMLNLSRNLGLITGASVMGAVFALASATTDITTARPEAVATGMRITFAVAAVLIVVALAIAAGSRALAHRSGGVMSSRNSSMCRRHQSHAHVANLLGLCQTQKASCRPIRNERQPMSDQICASCLSRRSFLVNSRRRDGSLAIVSPCHQPRQRPAADHARHPIGRCVGRLRRGLGAQPTGPRACCVEAATSDSFADIRQTHLPSTRCRKAISPPRCCWRICRPAQDDFLPHHVSRIFRRRRSSSESQIGRFRTAPDRARRSVSFVWSGDTAGQGWGIDEARGGMRSYRHHAAKIGRTSSSIPATTSMPIARSHARSAAERRDVAQHRHRRKIGSGADARRVSRQLQIQSARRQPARLQRRGADASRNGTTTKSPTIGGRAAASTIPAIRQNSASLLAARGRRAFREYMPMRQTLAESGPHLSQDRATARCSMCSCSTCGAIAEPNDARLDGGRISRSSARRQRSLKWLKRELAAVPARPGR